MHDDFLHNFEKHSLKKQQVTRRRVKKINKLKVFFYILLIPLFFAPALWLINYFGYDTPSSDANNLIIKTSKKKEAPRPRIDMSTIGNIDEFPSIKLLVNLQDNSYLLKKLPAFDEEMCKNNDSLKAVSKAGNIVFFSLDPTLQNYTTNILQSAQVPHVALVAMEPKTGKVLAMDSVSKIKNFELFAGMPAASLFKLVTATAALETGSLRADSRVAYRGNDLILNKWNYNPNDRLDTKLMPLGVALGKSCNPVFGRVALKYLNQATLMHYSRKFGFNEELPFEMMPPPSSEAYIPENDYELSRTGAGFGDVHLSPLHAAMIMAGISNNGQIPKPYMIDKIVSPNGEIIFKSRPQILQEAMSKDTSKKLLQMMVNTTTTGTSRKYFRNFRIPVAAKTGTLNGTNPKGLTNWFVAGAPANDPEIAIAVVIVHKGKFMKTSSQLGRQFLEKYFTLKKDELSKSL